MRRETEAELAFQRKVNERVLEAFCSRYRVRYRPDDVELQASALVWSINTKEGRAAYESAHAAEEFRQDLPPHDYPEASQ